MKPPSLDFIVMIAQALATPYEPLYQYDVRQPPADGSAGSGRL
jgi:hypothetical protein